MNAVTTAEYVVLDEINLTVFTEKLNRYAKEGFKLTNFETGLWEKDNQSWYTAVMVREPLNAAIARDFIGHFMVLATRVEALESKQNYYLKRIEELEKQVTDIENKIDWSK